MPLNLFVSDVIEAISSSSYLFCSRIFLSRRDVLCDSVSLFSGFSSSGVVGDIVLSGLADYLYRFFPLQLLLIGISRSTSPKELVDPPCGFARMKVYLSRLIRYCLTAQ